MGSGVTVGTYIDDIPVGGSSLYSNAVGFSLDLLPYDVSRIEVLSGPQGTLYGASTMGGLLKYALTDASLDKPHFQVGGDLQGVSGGGSVGGGARAQIEAPIIRDKLGVIASYAFEDTPGFIDNARTGQADENAVRQQGGRFSILWRPNDKLRVDVTALYQRIDADGRAQIALDPTSLKPIYGDLTDDNYVPQPFRKEITVVAARGAYDFGWATLTSISSYQYSDVKQVLDFTPEVGDAIPLFGGPATGGTSTYNQYLQLSKLTQEIRLASPANQRIEWLIGGFATYEHSRLGQVATAQDETGAFIPGINPFATIYLPTIYREYAGFGDVTFHVTSRFDISGGLRYSYNNQNYGDLTGGSIEPPEDASGKSSESVVTYSVSPSYRFSRDVKAYARIATGYQPGGPNVALPDVPPTVRSDTLTNYEVGLKTQFPRYGATFNIDGFYIDWNDIQVGALSSTGVGYITNGGTAKSEGVEAQGQISPVRGLTFGGTFAYIDARFTQPVPSISALKGDPIPETPRFSGSVTLDYSHPLAGGWTGHIGGGVRLQSSHDSLYYGGASYKVPGYSALDLSADVSNGRYTVRLFAKNATNSRGYADYVGVSNLLTGAITKFEGLIIQPRTVGLALDAKF